MSADNREKTLAILAWLEKREPNRWWRPGPTDLHDTGSEGCIYTTSTYGACACHGIPPPDLTSPEWFVRLLKHIGTTNYVDITRFLTAGYFEPWSVLMHRAVGARDEVGACADTPEQALVDAAFEMVVREEKKK